MTTTVRLATAWIAILALLVGCQAIGSRSSLPPPTESATLAPGATPSPTPTLRPEESVDPSDGCGTTTISIEYLPYTIASLAESGKGFVVAEVGESGQAFFNTADGEAPPGYGEKPTSPRPNPNARARIYTPMEIEVDEAISGSLGEGPASVLVAGGTVGCYTAVVDVAPRVERGTRYVLVLTDVQNDTGDGTLELQEAMFAWPFNDEGLVATDEGPMSVEEISEIVSGASGSPAPSGAPSPVSTEQAPG